MFVLSALAIGFLAFYVNAVSHSAPHRHVASLLHPRQAPNFGGDTPDFGSCNTTCDPFVAKTTACNITGGLQDPALPCLCTNDYVNTMATCVNCLAPQIDSDDLHEFQQSVETVVFACKQMGLDVDTPTLLNGTAAGGSTSPTDSSGGTSTLANPTGPASVTPSSSAGGNGTTHLPNGAVGVPTPRTAAFWMLGIWMAVMVLI